MVVVDSFPEEKLADGKTKFSFRTHNTGVFANDLPKRKASGKRFWFLGVVDFVVNEDGLIEQVNEWYSTDFDEVQSIEEYKTTRVR